VSADYTPALGSPSSAVIITGGASGIGFGCANALAAVGRPVSIWDLDADRAEAAAEKVRAEFGTVVHSAAVDVRQVSGLADAVTAARSAVGPIGGLVHSAGISGRLSLDDMTEEGWDAVVDVQFRAAPFLIKAVLSELRSTPGSSIVLVGSLASFIGYNDMAAYVSSKSAILGLVRALTLTLTPEGIRINAVCPGYIETPMLTVTPRMTETTPLGRLGRPREIATAVRFLLSDEATYVSGTSLLIDGGSLAGRL